MAKKKSKPKVKENKPQRTRTLEYKGWKAGDRCYAVLSGDTKPSLCDIKEFHPNDNITPSVSVVQGARPQVAGPELQGGGQPARAAVRGVQGAAGGGAAPTRAGGRAAPHAIACGPPRRT